MLLRPPVGLPVGDARGEVDTGRRLRRRRLEMEGGQAPAARLLRLGVANRPDLVLPRNERVFRPLLHLGLRLWLCGWHRRRGRWSWQVGAPTEGAVLRRFRLRLRLNLLVELQPQVYVLAFHETELALHRHMTLLLARELPLCTAKLLLGLTQALLEPMG
eukprot:4164420-Prymnesium_polylepis.1